MLSKLVSVLTLTQSKSEGWINDTIINVRMPKIKKKSINGLFFLSYAAVESRQLYCHSSVSAINVLMVNSNKSNNKNLTNLKLTYCVF